MTRFFRYFAAVAAVVLAHSTFAQTASAPAPKASTPIFSSVSVDETLTFWGKKNVDTVTELDSTISGKLFELAGWHITVPVYSQDTTGYGAIDLGLDYGLVKNADFLWSKTNLNVEVGAWMPTGSAGYNTENVNPHIGLNYDMTWGLIAYTQTFDYLWVGSYAYSPVFGNYNNYGVNAESFVAYKLGLLSVGVDLNQWYTEGSNVAFLGPKAEWKVSNNVEVNAGFGIPVWQDMNAANENSWNVTAGVGIKF